MSTSKSFISDLFNLLKNIKYSNLYSKSITNIKILSSCFTLVNEEMNLPRLPFREGFAPTSEGYTCGSLGKNSPANAEKTGSIHGSGRSLEKKMATHSSTLAWELPWTEKPSGLESVGLQSQTRLSD